MKTQPDAAHEHAAGKLTIILVTHGEIGRALLDVARYILGRPLENFVAVTVPFMGELQGAEEIDGAAPFAARQDLIRERIDAAMRSVPGGEGVLILTDVLGGTGFNAARGMLGKAPAAIVAGVNLPMVLKAADLAVADPIAAAAELEERSRRAIVGRIFHPL
ncbi:MAG: PTS sugar transporter subunit IIA [Thermodesulfobacteriota bacterium]